MPRRSLHIGAYSTALQGGPDAARGGVRLAVREDRPMLHYMHAWLPLLSVSLTAAVVFALASFIIGGAEF
jgi:hypothetical protein